MKEEYDVIKIKRVYEDKERGDGYQVPCFVFTHQNLKTTDGADIYFVLEWRDEYNNDRPHSSLKMKTPKEFLESYNKEIYAV